MAKQLLGVATFHVRPGKEKEFLKLLKEGPLSTCEKMGGRSPSLYFRSQSNDYVATAHWTDAKQADQFMNSKEMTNWQQKANPFLRNAPMRELYEILQENS